MAKIMKKNEEQLTHEYLTKILRYDHDTGEFWRIKSNNLAGTLNTKDKYCKISIRINGIDYEFRRGRLAWFYMHREWPPEMIDHIDRNRQNDQISNLRLASCSQNLRNPSKRRNCSSAYLGVSWNKKTRKWVAHIYLNKKLHSCGSFDKEIDAARAYNAAALARDANFHSINVI